MNHTILLQYENDHPPIVIDKTKTLSGNDFEFGESYIVLFLVSDKETQDEEENPDEKENSFIKEVVYEGNRKDFSRCFYDKETGEFTRKEEMIMGFKTVSKPRSFYDIPSSDIDKDCFFYAFTTQ